MEESNQSLKLNLGCGQFPKEGYLNVDKYGEPEFRFDLETFPWPWADNSVEHIILHHVLEHLGASTDIYLKIIGELYRVCRAGALIDITVPHPRHEDFIGDPTHVRAITPYSFRLFSKTFNKTSTASPLGSLLNVDFELVNVDMKLEPRWKERYMNHEINDEELKNAIMELNNVVSETFFQLKVIK